MIKTAEFIKSAVSISDLPSDDLSHYLLLGRSNVGKSSLINAVTNRKSLARVSQTPGKTITLNLYLLNQSFYLVDAPGYGYAKRSKTQAKSFVTMIRNYINQNQKLKKVILLIDFNIGPTIDDLSLYSELIHFDIPLIIVATKYDKLKSSLRLKQQKVLTEKFITDQKIYFTSSETKYGIEKFIAEVFENE
ncbi:Probable GTP-binding protein EngB [Acholeplasma oculi]|uniref:Probable GTP-binding protein EngB n=1 Tax=Acholeplasma oculi TaxID=35623 RepID=A0A061ABH4_9MOLU|nr:ribosome biogenesis GTP-binding protein YihA/YsxC [Acholeplasma oculi]CDR30749.1 Probable GTP-binding protein EngB [Acholeplasma oculi]SKC34841.1 GTP-binding protein [Acholeplasma oculi]SUT89645.1 Probable GTP-binding protein EngB [Acholeplasma oculi]